jgi:hypothetical protein
MTRYYDKRKNAVIHTVNRITDDLLAKKDFLLKVEITEENIPEGSEPKEKAFEGEQDGVWRIHKVRYYHVNTLEEEKEQKLKSLNTYLAPKFPAEYKQRNVGLGVYTGEKADDVVAEVNKWRDYFNDFETQILACETKDAVQAIDFRTEEDKKLDEEMLI